MYKCERCHYTTTRYSNLKNHLKKKNVCPPKFSNQSREQLLIQLDKTKRSMNVLQIANSTIYTCEFCNNTYKSRQARYKHKKTCEKKKIYDELEKKNNTEQLIIKLHTQVKKLMEEKNLGTIDTIDLSTNTGNNIAGNDVNQNNTQNNQQINIDNFITDNSKKVHVSNYGDEDISHITDKEFKEMIKDPYNAMTRLINAIHFNDSKPENQNLRIPNIKNPFIECFKDGIWYYGNQYKVLCKAYTIKKNILHEAFLRIEHQLDEKTKKIYHEYKKAADGDLFTVQSQLTDIKAAIISGTRKNPPNPSRYALRQKCCPETQIKQLLDMK
jgi:hypothetical protein